MYLLSLSHCISCDIVSSCAGHLSYSRHQPRKPAPNSGTVLNITHVTQYIYSVPDRYICKAVVIYVPNYLNTLPMDSVHSLLPPCCLSSILLCAIPLPFLSRPEGVVQITLHSANSQYTHIPTVLNQHPHLDPPSSKQPNQQPNKSKQWQSTKDNTN